MDLIKAVEIAVTAHNKQLDKAGLPYILHPLRVMIRAGAYGETGQIIAVLHDVLEDTWMTEEALYEQGFSYQVVDTLRILTRVEGEKYKNYIERVKQNALATVIKRYDIGDNLAEERLSYLPEEEQIRLRSKYLRALEILTQEEK